MGLRVVAIVVLYRSSVSGLIANASEPCTGMGCGLTSTFPPCGRASVRASLRISRRLLERDAPPCAAPCARGSVVTVPVAAALVSGRAVLPALFAFPPVSLASGTQRITDRASRDIDTRLCCLLRDLLQCVALGLRSPDMGTHLFHRGAHADTALGFGFLG